MRVCRHAWLQFQKISLPYHTIPQTALWNLKSKGVEGLVFELEIEGHGGIVTIGIPKAWGGGGRG